MLLLLLLLRVVVGFRWVEPHGRAPRPIDSLFSTVDSIPPTRPPPLRLHHINTHLLPHLHPAEPPGRPIRGEKRSSQHLHSLRHPSNQTTESWINLPLLGNIPPETTQTDYQRVSATQAAPQRCYFYSEGESASLSFSILLSGGGWGRRNEAITGCSQGVDGLQTY